MTEQLSVEVRCKNWRKCKNWKKLLFKYAFLDHFKKCWTKSKTIFSKHFGHRCQKWCGKSFYLIRWLSHCQLKWHANFHFICLGCPLQKISVRYTPGTQCGCPHHVNWVGHVNLDVTDDDGEDEGDGDGERCPTARSVWYSQVLNTFYSPVLHSGLNTSKLYI